MDSQYGRIINVIIVEDESLFRDMLRRSLAQDPGIEIVGAYAGPHEVLAEAAAATADAAILDIGLSSDINGFELALRLRRQRPELGIVLLSNFREEAFIAAFQHRRLTGWAYLLKTSVADVDTLTRAVKGSVQGLVIVDPELVNQRKPRPRSDLEKLTPRQRDILGLVAQGYSNQAIADRLGIAVKSVENHMSDMLSRLEIDSNDPDLHPRVAAVLRYLYETKLS